jgi:tRNA-splicing ligase RtcB
VRSTIQSEGARPIHLWASDIEEQAMQQVRNLSTLHFLHPHGVAVMPDAHAGIGSTVGSVIATVKALVPAAVGVDIGCGMNAVRTTLTAGDLPDHLSRLRSRIEERVPMGAGQGHDEPSTIAPEMLRGLDAIACKNPKIGSGARTSLQARALSQMGTLGGGNHFIELCLDEANRVWVMLHSGSRGVGNIIGRYFIEQAQAEMQRRGIRLADRDLAYLPEGTQRFDEYVAAVHWAQAYALANRREMMKNVIASLREALPHRAFDVSDEAINCHHNYVEIERHFGIDAYVTRKGAIRAREGDMGIIPGSMGQRSYIVRGKGNPDSYCSCSHGAGRRMSRGKAKATFTVGDLKRQTAGVECRKDADVLDEIPGAYKDLDVVMANQTDLVAIVHTLKAVLCCKGN